MTPAVKGTAIYLYWYWDWYQIPQELGRPMWSEPYFDEGSGNIIMSSFSVPFYRNAAGKETLQGIVEADVSLMWLQDIVQGEDLSDRLCLSDLAQRRVRHLSRRDVDHAAQHLQPRRRAADPRLRQVGRDMIRGGEGLVPIQDFTSGKKSWLYYAPLPSTGWSLGVVFPDDELFAECTP